MRDHISSSARTGRILTETPIARDKVTDLAYSPDGKAIAIGYRNGRVEYFKLVLDSDGNPSIHRRPLIINAHQGEVTGVRFIDAKTLATCGTDEFVRIWKIPTETGRSFDRTESMLQCLSLSPDGSLLLYVGHHELLIADMEKGEVQYRVSNAEEFYENATWSPTGDRVARLCRNSARVAILERSGLEVQSITTGSKTPPAAVAFSPDGKLIAIIDLQKLQLCRSDNGQVAFRKSLNYPGIAVAFSHSGDRLAYGQRFGGVFVLDISR